LYVVGDASDLAEATLRMRHLRPDVAVVEARILTPDGASVRALKHERPGLRVVALLASDDESDWPGHLQDGADAHVAKSAPTASLIRSILEAMDGEAALGHAAMRRLVALTSPTRPNRRHPAASGLSERERQVLRLVAAGADNGVIAGALRVSEGTVRSHLHHLQDKLGLETRVQITLYAVHQGIDP
jgi:DNA-binding NarL/FixJ family response regulator